MKYPGMPAGMWALFVGSFRDKLTVWSGRSASVTAKSFMCGYRDIYKDVGLFHKRMIRFCDSLVNMKIVKIVFKEA